MLPATRLTATALDAFLQVAGHRLYAAYGRQFVKLLHCVDDEFLADLRKVRPRRSSIEWRACGACMLLSMQRETNPRMYAAGVQLVLRLRWQWQHAA